MVPVRSLVHFLSTLQSGSVTATARRFGLSLPTVSSSIARLEAVMGHPLFLRTPRGLVATEDALASVAEVEAILRGLLALEGHEVTPTPDLQACHAMTLSLRLIERFVAVVQAGSIGSAAQALRITQPQISRQILELEALFGEPLFQRTPTGVIPTDRAQAIYARCLPICDLAQFLVRRGNRAFSQALNTTRIGSVPPFHPESRLAEFLARLCLAWGADHPRASLSVVTDTTDVLIAGLMADDLHAVVVEIDDVPEGCDSRILLRSELALLAAVEGPAEEVIARGRLVLQGRASGLRRIAEDWLRRRGVQPAAVQEVDAMPVIGRLVSEPGYCSLVPAGAYPTDGRTVRLLPLTDAPVFAQRLVWRKDRAETRPLRRLLTLAERVQA